MGNAVKETKELPRVLFAAPASGSGKTTIVCGMLQALMRRGMDPVAFKCGPDYIDPMFHRTVLQTPSYNLDLFFCSEDQGRTLVAQESGDAGIAVFEGVMGYYDGLGPDDTTSSAYNVAVATQTPTILVVSARGASLSVAAMVKGFMDLRPDSNIRGVILNGVNASMVKMLGPAVERECGVPVVGCLPRDEAYSLESRHLGLVSAAEVEGLRGKMSLIADAVEENVDMDAVIRIARSAPPLGYGPSSVEPVVAGEPVTIAVADDPAFCFYYAENLQMLEQLGARVERFSPISDVEVPEDACAIYFGGGYPELHGPELEANESMRSSVRAACEDGMPVFAECGGFMYLQNSLEDLDHNSYRMAGFLDSDAHYTGKLTRFGYVNLESRTSGGYCLEGERFPGHEFHYYDSSCNGDAFVATKPSGKRSWECFVQKGNVLAGFPHIYFPAAPGFVGRFVEAAADYRAR